MQRTMRPTVGVTVLELVIAGTILMIIIGIALIGFARTNRQMTESMVIANCTQHADKLELRLQTLLRSAGQLTLVNTDADPQFERFDFREATGATASGPTFSADQSRVAFLAERANESDIHANDGRLVVMRNGVEFEELAHDIKDDFEVAFYTSGGTPTNNQSPDPSPGTAADEIRVSFTVLGVMGPNPAGDPDGPLDIHEEHRVLRIALRNQ